MSYTIIVEFQSALPPPVLTAHLQALYDAHGVDGGCEILYANAYTEKPDDDSDRCAFFHRETEDDVEFVRGRIAPGIAPIDEVLAAAAVAQLLDELTLNAPDPVLEPLLDALRSGRYTTENIDELR